MIPVDHGRLRSGREITEVLRGRRQRAGRFVVLHVRRRREEPSGDDDATRIAVIASRRVGNAVARNRAKRLLREAARHTPFVCGLDVVLVARPGCVRQRLTAVHAELQRLARDMDVCTDVDPMGSASNALDNDAVEVGG